MKNQKYYPWYCEIYFTWNIQTLFNIFVAQIKQSKQRRTRKALELEPLV